MKEEPRDARPLAELIGATCLKLVFVRDYVQMHFDVAGSPTFIGLIKVSAGGKTATFPEPGSRDALCSLIGSTVESAEFWRDDWIQVQFASGATLTVEKDPFHPNWEAWDWFGAPPSFHWDGL